MMQRFYAFLQQQQQQHHQVTYEEFGLDREEVLQGLAQRDEAMEEALDKVSFERGIFYGYDSDGYLACYRLEMELMGIPTRHMIKEFDRLVAPELHDQIQELID
ncbi:hypothetical protein GOP47_0009388, partial [Adiantum capillus-veneris]